ncbi:MAG TPA: hypothetical protein VN253_09215 [Kofleriaceae bacterium]|nr:hypothetical protein [Kofleriaceae bacterium]
MSGPKDPGWNAIRLKVLLWEERLRAREREIQSLDVRFRDLEQRLRALKARLALGTGVMAAVTDPAQPDVSGARSWRPAS